MIDWPQVIKDVTAQLRNLRADAAEVMTAVSTLAQSGDRQQSSRYQNQGADRARDCRGGAL
jgi:hypothetical protein